MKKTLLILLVISMFIGICPVYAEENTLYTVTVSAKYGDPSVSYSGINTSLGNVVYNKLEGMGALDYYVEYDSVNDEEIITAVFNRQVDKLKIQERLNRIPQFEIRDWEGNILLEEVHLSHATEYGRIIPGFYGDGITYFEPDEYGQLQGTATPENPEVDSVVNFIFTDEGEKLLAEVTTGLAAMEEGKNRFYIYINDVFLCSYKAKAGIHTFSYLGKTEKENSMVSFSVYANGIYLMPEKAEVIKTEGPYVLNCSPWAVEYAVAMFSSDVISLEDDDDYTQAITREEFCEYAAKIIRGQVGRYIDINDFKSDFKDTKSKEVAMLSDFGIINGKGDGIFAPSDNITREEASAILCRMLNYLTGKENTVISDFYFSDHNKISDWAKENVYAAYESNIMTGMGNNEFDPQGSFTKEQSFVTFLRIMVENTKQKLQSNAF